MNRRLRRLVSRYERVVQKDRESRVTADATVEALRRLGGKRLTVCDMCDRTMAPPSLTGRKVVWYKDDEGHPDFFYVCSAQCRSEAMRLKRRRLTSPPPDDD